MSEESEGIDNGEEQELTEASLEKASGGSARRAELDHVGAYNFTVEIEGTSDGESGANEIRMNDSAGVEEKP